MWKPKTVATTDNVYTYLISIIVSQSVAADGSLFISIANVKHKCHYIYNGINNSTDTKK